MKERKLLWESRPAGCYAKPVKSADGSVNMFLWEAGITPLPYSKYTLPDGGTYRLFFEFKDFPASPPVVKFSPAIFHTKCVVAICWPPPHKPPGAYTRQTP